MRKLVFILLVAASPVTAHAQSQPAVDALSRCLADNTSGKDRKDLARWVFLAMAAHPEIKQYASPSASTATDESNKVMAATLTRLLTESCVQQTQAAVKSGGGVAVQVAFQTLGQLAMQELMSDRAVSATMGAFEKHVDQEKLAKVLGRK